MARTLGWIPSKAGASQPGTDPWGIGVEAEETLTQHAPERLYVEQRFKDTNILADLIARARDYQPISPVPEHRVHGTLLWELPASLFIYKALEEEPALLWNCLQWFHEHAERFLFYPVPGKSCHGDSDRSRYALAVRWVDQYCKDLAERLLFNDELLLEAPLQHISAAAELPLIERPVYCSGRILLSLHYSANKYQTFQQQLRREIAPQ